MRRALCGWLAHTHTHTHSLSPSEQVIFTVDTASRSRSVLEALEDCDWWCSRLQSRGYLPENGASDYVCGGVCVCSCVYVREWKEERGPCEGMCVAYLSALQLATNVKSEFWPFRLVVIRHFQLK